MIKQLNRRMLLASGAAAVGAAVFCRGHADRNLVEAGSGTAQAPKAPAPQEIDGYPDWSDEDWRALTSEQWRERLSTPQFKILREEATERAFASPLNTEDRDGWFACAGCGLVLFGSAQKYDSGTGWPSFWAPAAADRVATKVDRKLIYPRTEYHCARCGGHQGHVFNDGPIQHTGKRYCNNGYALVFRPAEQTAA